MLILAAEGHTAAVMKAVGPNTNAATDAADVFERIAYSEMVRRKKFATPLHRAADAYLVRRGDGQTIIAGYPWFTDWGRDTFISLRGLCLAIDRIEEAKQILLAWAGTVSEGMLPNRFPDAGDTPEFNSVDASLWFIVAVHELFDAAAANAAGLLRRTIAKNWKPRFWRLSTVTRAAHALAFAWTATVCSRPASRAGSSRGWTRKLAIMSLRRVSASRWKFRRCG